MKKAITARKNESVRDRFEAQLEKASVTETKRGKGSSKMILIVPKDEIRPKVDEYLDAKDVRDKAQVVMDATYPVIVEACRERQDEDGYKGNYRKSYQVAGLEGTARYTTQNRFSINGQDKEILEELLGENFDGVIRKKQKLEVNPEVFEDEALMGELLDLMGDSFGKFLRYTWELTAREDADRNLYRAVGKRKLPLLRTYMRQYSPSLK